MLNNWLYIPEINKDVEVEVHDKGKSFDELKQIYGEDVENKLLSKEEVLTIQKLKEVSKILKMDGSSSNDDFYIKQYNGECRKKGLVADFCADYEGYCLECSGGSDCSFFFCGVRFVRKHIKGTPQLNESNSELIIEEIKFLENTSFVCEFCGSDEDYIGYDKVKERSEELKKQREHLEWESKLE